MTTKYDRPRAAAAVVADPARRATLRRLAGAGLATFAVSLTALRDARAAVTEKLSEGAAEAQALGYVHDASSLDATAAPQRTPQMTCGSCQLYHSDVDGWGQCGLFPARLVSTDGWCKVWVKRSAS